MVVELELYSESYIFFLDSKATANFMLEMLEDSLKLEIFTTEREISFLRAELLEFSKDTHS